MNQKCVDPCPGACGSNSKCRVKNHSPLCSCSPGYTGDPFLRCYLMPRKFAKNTLNLKGLLLKRLLHLCS